MASDTTNQTSWTIKGDTSTRPCLTRMSIVSSTINLLLKLSSLPRSSTSLSFSAATKMYWPGTDESGKNLSHIILTYVSNFRATPEWNLSLLPLGSKTHLLSGAVRPSLELPEVCGAGPPEFECPLQGFSLIHKILLGSWDATNFISCTIRIENRGKPTWYAASMQESTIFAIGFNCFKSNNSHPCFSRMIYRTDNISNFNTHFYTITCRSKTIQNGLELVQVVHRALGLCMQHFQVTIMSLWLILSRESSCRKQSSTYLSDDPELQSWNYLNEIYLEVGWGTVSISEAIEEKINLHFVVFCDSETRCFQRSSNLMLTWPKRSPSEARPNVKNFLRRDSLYISISRLFPSLKRLHRINM